MPSPDNRSPLAALAGRSVAVWGMGREGRASLEALAGVPVADLAVVDDQMQEYTTTDGRSYVAHTGDAGRDALVAADIVLKTPGISRYEPRAQAVIAAATR